MAGPDPPRIAASDHARLARIVMRRQANLSLRVAVVFLALLLGLPLVNYTSPRLAATPIFGFPASWLFLGVVFYPITVALSVYFIRRSDKIEAECSDPEALLRGEDRP